MTASAFRDRFTDAEWTIYVAGRCSWVTEYGNWNGIEHCCEGAAVDSPAPYGYCPEHEAQRREAT